VAPEETDIARGHWKLGSVESGCRIDQTQLRSGNDGSGEISYNSMQGCPANLPQQTCRHGKSNQATANRRKFAYGERTDGGWTSWVPPEF